jgi:hypothetical protein
MTPQVSGEGIGGLEIAATGTERDTSTCMVVSVSVVDTGLSGMTNRDGDDARCTCERAQVVLQTFNYGCSLTPLTSLFEKISLLLVLQKIDANTIQISKTAARPLRGSKLFYLFLMLE